MTIMTNSPAAVSKRPVSPSAFRPLLYVGTASPLVEAFYLWEISAHCGASHALHDGEFLRTLSIYDVREANDKFLFKTPSAYGQLFVARKFQETLGTKPVVRRTVVHSLSEVPTLTHGADLEQYLKGRKYNLSLRKGLTRRALASDLGTLMPELVAIHAHGDKEGLLLLEDAQGRADLLDADSFFALLTPATEVVILFSCYSEQFVRKAKALPQGLHIVSCVADKELASSAALDFLVHFLGELNQRSSICRAFHRANEIATQLHPGLLDEERFRLHLTPSNNCAQQGCCSKVVLSHTQRDLTTKEVRRVRAGYTTVSRQNFVGRQNEMVQVLEDLVPLPAGLDFSGLRRRPRLITLTKEGGIGKTALALRLAEWLFERGIFSGGIYEVPCEQMRGPRDLHSALLKVVDETTPGDLRDDLSDLEGVFSRLGEDSARILLVLDNVDTLINKRHSGAFKQSVRAILIKLLDSAPGLKILATSRWPVDLGDHEVVKEVPPLNRQEAFDLFLLNLEHERYRTKAKEDWEIESSPVRQLVELSGCHPQSIQLLARQLSRPGMTFEKLYTKTKYDLLSALRDPSCGDEGSDRHARVEVSYSLSYDHLSPEAKQLFARLSMLPGGILVGHRLESLLDWASLLGENWRSLLERELEYYALVHFEPDSATEGFGVFRMLPPMREYAAHKFQEQGDDQWLGLWRSFWRDRIDCWTEVLDGKANFSCESETREEHCSTNEPTKLIEEIFGRTKANWLEAFHRILQEDAPHASHCLQRLEPLCQITGDYARLRELAQNVVNKLLPEKDVSWEPFVVSMVILGDSLGELGRESRQLDCYERALDIVKERFDAANIGNVRVLNRLAETALIKGDKKRGKMWAEKVRELTCGQEDSWARGELATSLCTLGKIQEALKEPRRALDFFVDAMWLYCSVCEESIRYVGRYCHSLNRIGLLLSELSKPEQALDFHKSAAAQLACLAERHPRAFETDYVETLVCLGKTFRILGEARRSRVHASRAVEALELIRRMRGGALPTTLGLLLEQAESILAAERVEQGQEYPKGMKIDPAASPDFRPNLAGANQEPRNGVNP